MKPTLRFLLSNLLSLNSSRIFFAKAQFCNGHIIQNDIEILSTFCQLSSYQKGDLHIDKINVISRVYQQL